MEHFHFWHSGMCIFPMIGLCVMIFFIVIMLIFCRRGFGGSFFQFPCNRHWDYNRHTKDTNNPESALDILNRRYANGEIAKEEYERIKKDILS